MEEGLDAKEFHGKFGFTKDEAGKLYLEVLMQQILNDGLIKKVGNTYAITDHIVKLDPKTKEQLSWLKKTIENVGLDVPDNRKIEDLALYEKIKKDKLKMMLKYLARQHKLVFHQGEYLHADIVDKSRKTLFDTLKDRERGMNEKEIRLLLNSTKKFVKLIIGIFVEEGIIYQQTFYVMITDKRKRISVNLTNAIKVE